MKKKKLLIGGILLFISIAILSGCTKTRKPVDVLSDDGKYHYYNDLLGFELSLPESFKYYQVQRINNKGFTDVEYMVASKDNDYPKEFTNFAKVIVVRIYDKNFWDENSGNINPAFKKIGEKSDKIYTIKFWEEAPSDWQDKWNEEVKHEIINSFKIQ